LIKKNSTSLEQFFKNFDKKTVTFVSNGFFLLQHIFPRSRKECLQKYDWLKHFFKTNHNKGKMGKSNTPHCGQDKKNLLQCYVFFFYKIKTIRSTFSKFSKFHETLPFSTSKSHEWHVENKELLF